MIVALLAGLLAAPTWLPHDPARQYRDFAWSPPSWQPGAALDAHAVPTRAFAFGTDELGRDLFSRFVVGARTSLATAALATGLTVTLAMAVGVTAAASGGAIDAMLMAAADTSAAAPWLLLAVALRALLPLTVPSRTALLLTAVVIGLASWPRPARHVRATVQTLTGADFVLAARACGASTADIARRHLLPHLVTWATERAAALLPRALMAEVTLSALGLGASEPTASWGTLVGSLQRAAALGTHWWTLLPLATIIIVLWLISEAADRLRGTAI